MKNVILFLIDSAYVECFSDRKTRVTSTPFIDKLIHDGINISNVYSFGPYTDSATKGLYTCSPTLDNYGFYFNFNLEKNNHLKTFKENGYETISFYYPHFLISSNVSKYIDHSVFTSGFLYESVWNGKYKYYSERYKKNLLTKKEYDLLILFTRLLFDCLFDFYNRINSESEKIIKRIKVDVNEAHTGVLGLKSEYEKYKINEIKYINSILEKGMKHELAYINDYDFSSIVDKDAINYTLKKYRSFFIKLFIKNFHLNIKNGELRIDKVLKKIVFSNQPFSTKRFLSNCLLLVGSSFLMNKRAKKGNWQLTPSAFTQVDSLTEVIKNRKGNAPFFATIHVEEPHHNINFYSYDIKNRNQIDEEISIAEKLLEGIGSEFHGNVMYQLSLRYVDYCIETLFKRLKKENLLDDTIFVLSADHGSSYTFNTIRDTVTNNFYEENYRIPFIIWDKHNKQKGVQYSGLYSAQDVFPTIFDYVSLNKTSLYKGKSVFSMKDGRDTVFIEFTGPGVPDMLTKQIWISARNKKFQVSYVLNINEKLFPERPNEVYDLVSDPEQNNNIRNTEYSYEILELISAVEKRYQEIINNNFIFLSQINNLRNLLPER